MWLDMLVHGRNVTDQESPVPSHKFKCWFPYVPTDKTRQNSYLFLIVAKCYKPTELTNWCEDSEGQRRSVIFVTDLGKFHQGQLSKHWKIHSFREPR